MAVSSTPYFTQIGHHVAQHVGPIARVFRGLGNGDLPIHLLIVPPAQRPVDEAHPMGTNHWTIVTAGLSARPMTVPAHPEGIPRHAELMVALPARWPGLNPDGGFDQERMSEGRNWWPVRCLDRIARMPHERGSYVAIGQTIPNGEQATPLANNTMLGGVLVLPPLLSPGAAELVIDEDVRIQFYTLVPLYPEELRFKAERGFHALVERLDAAGVNELILPDRPNTCG